jgi:hypothetical protein
MPSRALVVDANILVRAVLGKRVRAVIEAHAEKAAFFVPEVSYSEAEEHLATLVARRGGDPEKALTLLRSLRSLMVPIGSDVYGKYELKLAEGWPHGIQKIGRFWSLRWRLAAQSGPKTRIFRLWRGHVDIRPRPHVFTGVTTFREWATQASPRSKITWNAKTTNLVL